jgi:tRNA(fMet)-specific endonuclease VapC
MIAAKALIDTNILSALMRRRPAALARAQGYLTAHGRFTFSILTRYEILRGLKARGATRQLAAFEAVCGASEILPLTDAIIERAADVYADLYRRGALIDDADVLIAATALEHGLVMVTDNEDHFLRIPSLRVDNWLA